MRRSMSVLWIAGLLAITASPAFAQEGGTASVEGGTEPGSPEPAPAYIVDISVAEVRVDGAAVDRIPVGADAEMTLRATNTSPEAADHVMLQITPPPNAEVSPASVSFGDLAGEAAADRKVTVKITTKEGCEDFVGFSGGVSSSLGEHEVKFGWGVACPGPRLMQELVEFVGGDGDGTPEPGETLEVFITYRNHGADPATDVEATARTSSAGVTFTDASAAWGTIAPNTSVRATEPFVVRIADDAATQDMGCSWDGGGMTVEDDQQGAPDEPVSSDGGGSTGSDGGAATSTASEPSSGDAEEPALERGSEEPASDTPTSHEDGERRMSQDPAVAITAELTVSMQGTQIEDTFSNQIYCTMMETQRGAGEAGDDTKAIADGVLTGGASGAEGRGGAIALAGVLLAAVGSQVGWRVVRARPSANGG